MQLLNLFLLVNAPAPLQVLSRTSSHKLEMIQHCTSSFHMWTEPHVTHGSSFCTTTCDTHDNVWLWSCSWTVLQLRLTPQRFVLWLVILDTFCDMSWYHITGLFLQNHKTPLLLALETTLEDDELDNSDVIKMLLEKGAVYDVKDGVSYAVYNVTKHVDWTL